MTKGELINVMCNEAYTDEWCQSDFHHDKRAVIDCDEPFFWAIRHSGTSLDFVGPTRMLKAFDSEAARIGVFRNRYAPIADVLYCFGPQEEKFFFWNGSTLLSVDDRDDFMRIYDSIWLRTIEALKEKHPLEYAVCCKSLDIEISCTERYGKALSLGERLNDNSLSECIERLSTWQRVAVDHKIVVRADFCEHSFFFTEMVNGESRICGGIIYSEDASDGRHWRIHT